MNEFLILNLPCYVTSVESLTFVDKPMGTWLQIATDDVDTFYVIGESDARAVATSNNVPPARAMRTDACFCRLGYYGWRRPRTKLREDPHITPSWLRDTRC